MRLLPRLVLSWALLLVCQSLHAQQSAVSPQQPSSNSNSSQGQSEAKQASKEVPSFLIIGTVFNEHALSFPGVQVRIRRSGEKKYQWETYTDSRGEFAVRVPPGHDYEVLVHVKKYKDQTKSVDSKVEVQQRLSIRLELVTSQKAGAKS